MSRLLSRSTIRVPALTVPLLAVRVCGYGALTVKLRSSGEPVAAARPVTVSGTCTSIRPTPRRLSRNPSWRLLMTTGETSALVTTRVRLKKMLSAMVPM